jgi:hypothetical protein
MPDMRFSQVFGMMLEMLRDALNNMLFLSDAPKCFFVACEPVFRRVFTALSNC